MRGIRFAPSLPQFKIIIPPEKLVTWFPINANKGTKELFSSYHAAIFLTFCINITLKSQEIAILLL